jgi:trk system potassium uptake protein TrkA
MYIILIGAGEVGAYLAEILVAEGQDVAVIEANEALADELDDRLDALVIKGSGVTREALEQAGVLDADLVLAVTTVDEVNMVACMVAKRISERVRAVARVRGEQYYRTDNPILVAADLGIDLIMSPERAVAEQVLDLLRYAGAAEIRHLANDRLVLVEVLIGAASSLLKGPLAELRAALPERSLVVAIEGEGGFRIPRGHDRLAVEERAYVLTVPGHINEVMALSGTPSDPVHNILIVGCGDIGFGVARELERSEIYPVILEKDEERAEWLAGKLPRSLVVHGDGANLDLLRERVEQERVDAAVFLMDDDEDSLLIGLFAKSLGVRKIICRCDNLDYRQLANRLGVDAIVTPKRAVANAILRYVRRGSVESSVVLGDHQAEIIHFRVPERPKQTEIITRPLKDLQSPRDALVGAVIRKGEVFIPNGDTLLDPGDELLIAVLPQALQEVERLLGPA